MDVSETLDEMGVPMFVVKTPKFASAFEVRKKFGRGHYYEIKRTKGDTPKALAGLYTNHERALSALSLYIIKSKDSQAVQRNKKTTRREKFKQDASTNGPDNKEHVQQGTPD